MIILKDVKINKKTITNFNLSAVEITDMDDQKYQGYFVIQDKQYYLLPFSNYFVKYKFHLGNIKTIKHLTNDVAITTYYFGKNYTEVGIEFGAYVSKE